MKIKQVKTPEHLIFRINCSTHGAEAVNSRTLPLSEKSGSASAPAPIGSRRLPIKAKSYPAPGTIGKRKGAQQLPCPLETSTKEGWYFN